MPDGEERRPRRVIVGMTGATGAIFGIRLLQALRDSPVESHLIVSAWSARTISMETDLHVDQVTALADAVYDEGDLGAPPSSGSFLCDGMVVAPCSMKTLAAVAHGIADNLILRAADVTLKERRTLVLLARESPLSAIHLENMLRVTRAGGIVAPPMPAFYSRPRSIDDMVDHTVGRVLDHLGVEHHLVRRWGGDGGKGGS